MTNLQITLPDDLANAVRQAGLLTPEAIEAMLREKLKAQQLARLAEARVRAQADGELPMSMDEINAEIKAYRAEKRRAAGS